MSDLESYAMAIIRAKELFDEIVLMSSEENTNTEKLLVKIRAASWEGLSITNRLLDTMKVAGVED